MSLIRSPIAEKFKKPFDVLFQAVATLGPHRGKADYDGSAFPFRTDRNRSILNCWGPGRHMQTRCSCHSYSHAYESTRFSQLLQPTALFIQGQHQLVSCFVSADTHTQTHTDSFVIQKLFHPHNTNSHFASFNGTNRFIIIDSYQETFSHASVHLFFLFFFNEFRWCIK